MRALACLVPAVLLVAADPDPATFIQPDAVLSARAPDLQRSQARWKATPYPVLLQSVWGRMLLAEWGGRIERVAPGAGAALAGLHAAAVGLRTEQGSMPAVVVALQGQAAQLRAAALPLMPESLPGQSLTLQGAAGRATLHGGVLAWANGPGEAVLPEGQAEVPVDPEADLLVRLDIARWSAVMGLPAHPRQQDGPLEVAVRLDAVGMRETITVPASEASRLAAVSVQRWADPEELRQLPASTLWATTWHAEPKVSGQLLPAVGDPAVAQIERMLADAGLPGWRDTWLAIDGPVTICMSEGVPFPSLTCAVSMSEEVARRWIAAAATRLNLAIQDGVASGFIGLLSCSIGWIAADASGRLVVTTDPAGLDAWRQRKPGFAEYPGVRAVLSTVPPRTVLLGAGRGGASWAALAQLTVPIFTAMGAPQAVSLPVDLRKASDRGWIYAQLQADGTAKIESGGLTGGLITTMSMAGIAVPATIWLQGEQRRQRVEEPAPEAAPQPAPVF
jgi:hypothetical protein